MTVFWIIAALMLAAALALLAPALLGRGKVRDQDRNQQNVQIARERLQELESEFGRGVLTEVDYEQAKQELEQALLSDVEDDASDTAIKTSAVAGRLTLLVLLVVVPLLTVFGYLQLGTPTALDSSAMVATEGHGTGAGGEGTPSVQEMVEKLAEKLEQDPNNAEGWFMLGRSYMMMARYSEAANAFGHAYDLAGDQPALLLRYADALAMSQGGKISGKAFELIKKALQASPNDATALWLGGLGYEEQGDYEQAVRLWRKLEPMLVDNPESLNEVRNLIARAEQQLGHEVKPDETAAQEPAAAKPSIKVQVTLDKALQDKAAADDLVFIFARALEGPPMPLAAARKRVSDLPVEIILDDSMAMMPQLKISNYKEVRISARISKSGTAMPASGDLEAGSTVVSINTTEMVNVHIDRVVP